VTGSEAVEMVVEWEVGGGGDGGGGDSPVANRCASYAT
jgi:hypothetical protein